MGWEQPTIPPLPRRATPWQKTHSPLATRFHHANAMPIRAWFPTFIYSEPLQKTGLVRFNAELADECRKLRDFDAAGRRWSKKNYPGGYTSYASMNELHRFSSTFAGLEKRFIHHVRAFARALEMDLRGRTI